MTDQLTQQLQAVMQRFVAKRRSVSLPGLDIRVVEDKGRLQLRVCCGKAVLHARPTQKGAVCLANMFGPLTAIDVLGPETLR